MASSGQAKKQEKKELKAEKRVVKQVRRALIQHKGEWKEISRQAEGSLTYRWISAFAAGEITDPSYTRLSALAKHLNIQIGIVTPKAGNESCEGKEEGSPPR